MEITIALAQMDVALGRPKENQLMAQHLAAQAAAQDADLLLLPELWATGYDLDRTHEYAAPLDSGHFALMAGLAQTHQLYVAGTALEANPTGLPFNTAAICGQRDNWWAPIAKFTSFPPWVKRSRWPQAKLAANLRPALGPHGPRNLLRPALSRVLAARKPFAGAPAHCDPGGVAGTPRGALATTVAGPGRGEPVVCLWLQPGGSGWRWRVWWALGGDRSVGAGRGRSRLGTVPGPCHGGSGRGEARLAAIFPFWTTGGRTCMAKIAVVDSSEGGRMFDLATYLSPLTWRYGSERMRRLWSKENKRRLWRRIWLALAGVQAEWAW